MIEAKKAPPRKTSRRGAAPDAIANLVAAQTAKAAAIVAKAEETAAERIAAETLARIHEAAEVERAAIKKGDGIRAAAFNTAIDAARAAGLDTGEAKDLLSDIVWRAAAAGDLSESTARAYTNGLYFAIERHVPWTSNLHGAEAKVEALQAANKAIPKSLQAAAEKVAEKAAAKREAKNSKGHVASLETVVKSLAKALADSRAIGRVELSADILDVIHSIKPDFVEPKAND